MKFTRKIDYSFNIRIYTTYNFYNLKFSADLYSKIKSLLMS